MLEHLSDPLMTFFESVVIPVFVGGGTALAVLKFFGQRLVDHKLGKDIERFKSELSEKTESLKTQLSIYSHEQAVEISRVDAQSAGAISNVYARMREVMNPMSLVLSGSPIVDGSEHQSAAYYLDAAEATHAAVGRLSNVLADHAIYFEEPTYAKVYQFAKAAGDASALYLQPLRKAIAEGESAGEVLGRAEAGREVLRSAFDAAIRPLHKELVALFRQSLGTQR